MIFLHNPARGSRWLNSLFLNIVSLMLLGSLALHWRAGQGVPPLALLQQAAYVMAGIGLLLNMRLGPSPLHYAMVTASAVGGLAASAWVLLQTQAGLAAPWGGLRADTWHFLACASLVVFAVLMQSKDRKWGDNAIKKPVSVPMGAVMGFFVVAVLAQLAHTAYACGTTQCAAVAPASAGQPATAADVAQRPAAAPESARGG
ncbi:disulfide bond formation protein DsbB [Pseudomonadota bacterium AL_CKDN230030165-1A_HGKHYDSX7]